MFIFVKEFEIIKGFVIRDCVIFNILVVILIVYLYIYLYLIDLKRIYMICILNFV